MEPTDAYLPAEGAQAEGAREVPARETGGMPQLSSQESTVLEALSAHGECLTIGALRARTGYRSEDLRTILAGLHDKGLVARLNTVVESYAPRFPGLRVEGD